MPLFVDWSMLFDRSLREWLVGAGTRQRFVYLLAVIGITLVVSVIPDDWVSTSIWVFGGLGVGIGAVAGTRNYGVLTGVLGTAPYVAMVGQAAFLGQPVSSDPVVWVTRGVLVVSVATLGLFIPSYFIGVGVQIVARRRF